LNVLFKQIQFDFKFYKAYYKAKKENQQMKCFNFNYTVGIYVLSIGGLLPLSITNKKTIFVVSWHGSTYLID